MTERADQKQRPRHSRDAASWLAQQLAWEEQLAALRRSDRSADEQAA